MEFYSETGSIGLVILHAEDTNRMEGKHVLMNKIPAPQ
jgi:hypothetical protein